MSLTFDDLDDNRRDRLKQIMTNKFSLEKWVKTEKKTPQKLPPLVTTDSQVLKSEMSMRLQRLVSSSSVSSFGSFGSLASIKQIKKGENKTENSSKIIQQLKEKINRQRIKLDFVNKKYHENDKKWREYWKDHYETSLQSSKKEIEKLKQNKEEVELKELKLKKIEEILFYEESKITALVSDIKIQLFKKNDYIREVLTRINSQVKTSFKTINNKLIIMSFTNRDTRNVTKILLNKKRS